MYGFVSNPHQPTFVNTREQLGNTIIQQYFSRLVNMKSHNLCTKLTPPQGYDKLLGLGLTFCLQSRHPTQNFESSFIRFRKDIRTKYLFTNDTDNVDINKKIYIKNPDWTPEIASQELEKAITKMEKTLNHAAKLNQHQFTTNLTK